MPPNMVLRRLARVFGACCGRTKGTSSKQHDTQETEGLLDHDTLERQTGLSVSAGAERQQQIIDQEILQSDRGAKDVGSLREHYPLPTDNASLEHTRQQNQQNHPLSNDLQRRKLGLESGQIYPKEKVTNDGQPKEHIGVSE